MVTPLNVAEVLPRFFGLSRREAEAVAASIRPAAAIPLREVVTPIHAAVAMLTRDADGESATAEPTSHSVHPGELTLSEVAPRANVAADAPEPATPARPRDVEEPLSAELSRCHLTVSRRFIAKLQETKDALSHSHAGATTEEILIACMELMLTRKARQKGLVTRPLETPRPSRTDRIPAHVRREVMTRSSGRCEWVLENGERCNSSDQVECDHIQPKALGGTAIVSNIRATCRGHNLLAARRVFGDALMDRFTRERAG